jgi:serine phosphatase RsbU (regulator of sigma subunit)
MNTALWGMRRVWLAPIPSPLIAQPTEPGELFGFPRLSVSAAYWTSQSTDAEAIAAGIWHDVNAWSGDDSTHDDMTLVVVRVQEA